jgi:hypothetical protein
LIKRNSPASSFDKVKKVRAVGQKPSKQLSKHAYLIETTEYNNRDIIVKKYQIGAIYNEKLHYYMILLRYLQS